MADRELTDRVFRRAHEAGADLVGVTDHTHMQGETEFLGPDYRVIMMGLKIPQTAIADGKEKQVALTLEQLNLEVNQIALEVTRLLEDEGWKALPLLKVAYAFHPPKEWDKIRDFPYKRAAMAAGLGAPGKSQLLLTPQFGPRVRFVAVVTTAPLVPGKPFEGELCIEDCTMCIEACPEGALKPDGSLDRQKCWERVSSMEERYGYAICALCMAACPVGRPELK